MITNHMAVSGILVFVTSIFSSALVFIKAAKKSTNITWSLFSLSVALWGFSLFVWSASSTQQEALFWSRLLNLSSIFIPIFFYHFVFCFTERKKGMAIELFLSYAIIFLCFAIAIYFPNSFIPSVGKIMSFKYYPQPGILYYIFSVFFVYFTAKGTYLLFKDLTRAVGLRRNQVKYLLFGVLIGFIGGSTTFLPVFGIKIYPFGTYLVPIYVLTVTYAILKHRLMDINLALTRAGIFVFVYALVLGIPFGLAGWGREWLMSIWGQNWFWAPMALLLGLATAGPFIYQYLNKQAEELILKEQKQYQKALLETSSKMLLIKELDRLLKTAGITIIETVKVSFVGIYIEDEKTMKYTARYMQAGEGKSELPKEFSPESELVRHLCANKLPIIGEEVSASSYKIGLAVPLIIGDLLLGFMLLGEKPQGRVYTQDDVNVFTILANQIAMAIENCQFYAQEKERQALLYQSATLAQMGVMADSMGHQIKNHIQKMAVQAGAQAGILEELLKEDISREKAVELLKRHLQIFSKIEAQGKTGGELIASISKFSKLPRGEFKQTTIAEMLATANDMLRFKIKFERIDYVVDIADTLPQIYAHPILGEAFFNLIDNSYDSILDREDRLKEPGYRGRIAFQARCGNSTHVEIKIADNGMGIDEKILEHLFLPFYTTKATANKGQGLGLFVIKKIVDNHKGSITVDSKRLKGTIFTILLPMKASI